jgi:2-methylisocitrate lyase-like PEP mutase family enzyme
MSTQQSKARQFHELHHGKQILVLLNAWDAASARIFEVAGAPAIATTSSGLSASLGYPDGQKIPRELVISAVRQICRSVDIPVSVDLEAGYGTTVSEVCDSVKAVIDVGGIGINIEDAMQEPSILAERIAAIRAVAAGRDVPLFINARTDVYLRGKGTPAEHFDDAVRRLRAYEAAGADGLFVPGLGDSHTISKLLGEIHLPLNIMAGQGIPAVLELERLGVKRVSTGGGPQRAALTRARQVAAELLRDGTYDGFLGDTIPHAELNKLLSTAP